jgi:hypothetical protein
MEPGDVRHSLQGRLKSWTPNARSGRTEGIQLTLQSGAGEMLVLGCLCRMVSAFVSFYLFSFGVGGFSKSPTLVPSV